MEVLLTIEPFVGVGPLKFGMTREEVRRLLSAYRYETFRRTPSGALIDDYPELGAQSHYSEDDGLEFLECYAPAGLLLKEQPLFELGKAELLALLRREGDVVEGNGGFRSPVVGISVYAPLDEIEAIAVYCEGYYD